MTLARRDMLPPPKTRIDVSGFSEEADLHAYLAKAFDIPGYYGANWSGFFDFVMYDPEMKMPLVLSVHGLDDLRERLPRSAERFEKCLTDYILTNPERRVVFGSDEERG